MTAPWVLTQCDEPRVMNIIDHAASVAPGLTNKTRHELFIMAMCVLELGLPIEWIYIAPNGCAAIRVIAGGTVYQMDWVGNRGCSKDWGDLDLQWGHNVYGRTHHFEKPFTRENVLEWLAPRKKLN